MAPAHTSDGKPRSNNPPADAIELPDEREEAIRWLYAQALRIMRDRKWMVESIREAVADAKEKGVDPKHVRLASRLERMTPEKRVEWETQINGAAKLLGYAPLSLEDNPISDGPAREALNALSHLETERKAAAERLAELFAAAADFGDPEKPETQIDVKVLRNFLRMAMAGKDREEIGDWFDATDRMGKALGVWGANFDHFDDLQSETD
jgi:uncharacterized protein (UPF0335 family)